MRPVIARLLFAGVVSSLVGCSSFKPRTQAVRIDTDPTGLPVVVDGQQKGRSPVTVDLDRTVSHTIVANTTDRVFVRELHRKMSDTGRLDMVGGAMFLVPGLGLLTPGAWDLDSTDVMLRMDGSPTGATRPAAPAASGK